MKKEQAWNEVYCAGICLAEDFYKYKNLITDFSEYEDEIIENFRERHDLETTHDRWDDSQFVDFSKDGENLFRLMVRYPSPGERAIRFTPYKNGTLNNWESYPLRVDTLEKRMEEYLNERRRVL
jgi:hypothetical protein